MKRAIGSLLCGAALTLAAASPAWADGGEPFSFGSRREVYVLGGITGGGSFGSPGGGGFVGGELSLAVLKQAAWFGLYADGTYDFGHQAATFSAGPEFGLAVIGVDGGPAVRVGLGDEANFGLQGRLLFTLGAFALFGRYGYWFDSPGGTHIGQIGVLLKLPFWNSTPLTEMAE